MKIFNGIAHAQKKLLDIAKRVDLLEQTGKKLRIDAILFHEDAGSRFYSQKKSETAHQVGVIYNLHAFSISTSVVEIKNLIKTLNMDDEVTGIIIQKPLRKVWQTHNSQASLKNFDDWWYDLYQVVSLDKDVDGLHPSIVRAIEDDQVNTGVRVLPATVKAVLYILETENILQKQKKIAIIGKSDLLGKPLYIYLKHLQFDVELLGRDTLQHKLNTDIKLLDKDILISATGVAGLIKQDMVKQGVVCIDVGEPRADFDSLEAKASFMTPVPGGVGPLTVVSLLENAVILAEQDDKTRG